MGDKSQVIKLTHPIDVSIGGKIEACDELIVNAPSAKNFKQVSKLKSIVGKILFDVSSSDKIKRDPSTQEAQLDQDSSEIDAESLNQILYCFSDKVEYFDIAELVKEILINGGGSILDVPMGASLYGKLEFEDIENVTGGYIAHFLL